MSVPTLGPKHPLKELVLRVLLSGCMWLTKDLCVVPSLRMDGSKYLYSPGEHKDTQAQLYLIYAWRVA